MATSPARAKIFIDPVQQTKLSQVFRNILRVSNTAPLNYVNGEEILASFPYQHKVLARNHKHLLEKLGKARRIYIVSSEPRYIHFGETLLVKPYGR